MRVTVYARKSTSQEKATEEAKSVTRQVELACAFAARQDGWTISEDHVFVDDGVSGGIFDPKKRPGLAALLQAAQSKPRPFDVLVIMNQSRLARRQRYAVDIVHDLTDAGVRIFSYQTGLERKMDTSSNRFMVGVDAFQDEAYRESIQITTRETLRRKAERGELAGGKLYAYRNIKKGSHSDRVIEESEAAVLRRFFELLVSGKGFVRIGKAFNAEGIPSPGGHGWSPSALRAMAFNEHYRGVVIYGRTRWVDKGESKVKVAVPENEWIRVEAPHLRIIPEPLWLAAHERLAGTRAAYFRRAGGKLWGRPESGTESRYLLTGFAQCAVCGGSLFVRKRPDGKRPGTPAPGYYGSYHHHRGSQICANALQLHMTEADDGLLTMFRDEILNPQVIARAIEKTTAAYQAQAGDPAAQGHGRGGDQACGDRATPIRGDDRQRHGTDHRARRHHGPRATTRRSTRPPGAP